MASILADAELSRDALVRPAPAGAATSRAQCPGSHGRPVGSRAAEPSPPHQGAAARIATATVNAGRFKYRGSVGCVQRHMDLGLDGQ
jgi:hypothetical protein